MARRLTNFEFAQKRVLAERNFYKRAIIETAARSVLADPYAQLDEQAIVELKALLRSPLESEDDEAD